MRLRWEPIYDSGWIGIVLTVLVIGLLFAVTPRGVNPQRRRVLIALRVIAAMALLLTMLRPTLVSTDNRPTAATLVIAVDGSRSMTLASGETAQSGPASSDLLGGAETRWQQQMRVLRSIAEPLSSVDDSLNVTLLQFDSTANRIESGPSSSMRGWLDAFAEQTPDGNLTDLAAPLRESTNASTSAPLAGIALISDGTQTATNDFGARVDGSTGVVGTIDPATEANLIGAIGVPLWTVALGPNTRSGTVRDVAVTSLPETYRMFSGNETEVAFDIVSLGYAGRSIQVSLVWVKSESVSDGDSAANSKTAATRTVTVTSNRETIPVRVPLVAPEPGRYRLIARADSPPGETDASNDRQLAFVDVRAGGGRVLYLEGTPRLEQTFLRRALRRFPDLELSYRWIPRDTSARWPIDLAEDLKPGRFDIVMIGDLHSSAIGEKQLQMLADSVAAGTALVTLGGERAYGPGGYADSPLAAVLPIQMDASVAQAPGSVFVASDDRDPDAVLPGQLGKPFRLTVPRPHPITTINAPSTSWQSLPEMLGANRWPGIKTAPGVQTLLDGADGQPMMVVGEYGRGRVAAIAFDSTWTWWRSGASEFHRRFWRQLMLWLLSREETDEATIQLEMTHRRFIASTGSDFSATLNVNADAPTETPSVGLIAEIVLESGATIALQSETSTQTSGERSMIRLTGKTSDDLPPGIHDLNVRTSGGSDPLSSVLPFQVIDDTRELTAGDADHAILQRLSAATSASGGESFRADQVDELVRMMLDRRRRAERVVIDQVRLGDGPVSGWIVFVVFAGALSAEWYLRRRWGLA